jgi:hypothetical protein
MMLVVLCFDVSRSRVGADQPKTAAPHNCCVVLCLCPPRLVVVSFSVLLLALHYFACCLWLVLRVQVRRLCASLCLQVADALQPSFNSCPSTPCIISRMLLLLLLLCRAFPHRRGLSSLAS